MIPLFPLNKKILKKYFFVFLLFYINKKNNILQRFIHIQIGFPLSTHTCIAKVNDVSKLSTNDVSMWTILLLEDCTKENEKVSEIEQK